MRGPLPVFRRFVPLVALLCSAAAAVISATPPARAASPITHIVIIDEENHSFDEVLGKLCVEQARGKLVRAGLNMPCDGTNRGVLADGQKYLLTPEPDYGLVIDHKTKAQEVAIDGGKMDGFSLIHGCQPTSPVPYGCLSQFDPKGGTCGAMGRSTCIPNLARFAEDFAISDRTFEFHATPTYGGHMILGSATLQHFFGDKAFAPVGTEPGPGWGCDSGKVSTWVVAGVSTDVPSCIPDRTGNMGPLWSGYTGPTAHFVPTIFDRMSAAGVSWKIYGGEGSEKKGAGTGYPWTICPMFFDCQGRPSQYSKLVPSSQLITDATSGALPNVSIVTPTVALSAHQPQSMSVADNWVGRLVGAIASDPSTWDSTAIFITFDDCGCFYDHVNPLKYSPNWGIREPLIIVSPYAKAGYTDSKPATFVSMLAFIEHTFGLRALHPCATVDSSVSGCTDDLRGPDGTATYDFSDAFDYSQNALAPAAVVTTSQSSQEQTWLSRHPNAGDGAT